MTSRLMARLKGNVCFITVDANGTITPTGQPMTAAAGQDVVANQPIPEVAPDANVRDPAAPPETPEEKTARGAAALANETPEQKTIREAAEAKTAEEAADTARRAALTDEQRATEDVAKATTEATAKDKAWAERDVTKDVPVTADQKADIAKLATTREQVAAMERFTLETNTTNDLSPASRAEAAKLWGVSPAMVDQYVASVVSQNKTVTDATAQYDDNSEDASKWSPAMQSQFKARMDALEGVAGGKDNWAQFSTWAEANLKPEQMQTLQAAISASPIVGATVAKEFLAAWKAQGNGGGPTDVSRGAGIGNPSPANKVQPFASKDEQNAALNDPRYAKDPGYRNSIDQRMVISNFSQQGVEKSFYAGAASMM